METIMSDIVASKNGKEKNLLNLICFNIAPDIAQVSALNIAAN
jgi:hypothetical protein